MNLWGDGRVFVDPSVKSLDRATIEHFLSRGFAVDPHNPVAYTTVMPLPPGWAVDVQQARTGSGEAIEFNGPLYLGGIGHLRPDGLIDVYDANGAYVLTSTLDSGGGLLGTVTTALVMAGVGAGVAAAFAAPAAGATSATTPGATAVDPYSFSATDIADPMTSFDPAGWGGDVLPTYDVPPLIEEPLLFPEAFVSPPASAFEAPIPEITITPNSAPTTASGGFSLRDLTGAVKEVTGATVSVLQTVRAFQSTGGRVIDPTTPSRAANNSGMLVTRNSNGTITTTRTPVGVATVTADGGMVINNGDGTYTSIDRNGRSVTRRYTDSVQTSTSLPATLGGIDGSTLLLAGGAVLAMYLVGRTRPRR